MPLPDGFFSAMVDGIYRPILKWTWVGGTGWTALGGAPTFPGSAPVAAATTTGKATVTFTNVTGPDAPFTFTAQNSIDAGVTWANAVLDGTPGWVVGSTTTVVSLKTLTAGATVFKVTATGDNGATATSLVSNSVTIT